MDDLSEELSASFSTAVQLQAASAVITLQQLAREFSLNAAWVVAQLVEQAGILEEQAQRTDKPQFVSAYADILRAYADQVSSSPPGPPAFTFIPGGKLN